MLIRATDDFEFEWPDPADAKLSWMWDQMHMPRPLPPLSAELGMRMQLRVMGGRSLVVNGYPYRTFTPPPFAAATEAAASQPLSQIDPLSVWEQEQLPRLKEIVYRMRDREYDSMSSARLAGMLEELADEAGDAFGLTFGRAMAFNLAPNALIDFCEEELGSGGAVKATAMLQGFANESSAAGAGLSRLARLAVEPPGLAKAIAGGLIEDVGAVPGSEEFMREFLAYLAVYGLRAPSWAQTHLPTWAENPSVPLKLIARYLADPARGPEAALNRAVEQREEAIRDIESHLAADRLPRFREILKAAQRSVPVSEGRALWQLIVSGVLRIPLLALGRRLAGEGHLGAADDVFFFEAAELRDMAAGRGVPSPGDIAAHRRAELQHWGRLVPPRFLGAGPPPLPAGMMYRFLGLGVVEPSADVREVKGIPASKGVVQAVARVIMDLSDADKLGPGEVLVCPSTAPPWTPLFAIAGAVVTDSGGVLSHSAIAAREYAIPAVVGTSVATQRIPDGATVTVDGAQGTVRIEGGA